MESRRNIYSAPDSLNRGIKIPGDLLFVFVVQIVIFNLLKEVNLGDSREPHQDKKQAESFGDGVVNLDKDKVQCGGVGVLFRESFPGGTIATKDRSNFVPAHHGLPPDILEAQAEYGRDFDFGIGLESVSIDGGPESCRLQDNSGDLKKLISADIASGECALDNLSGGFLESEFSFDKFLCEVVSANPPEFFHKSGGREFRFFQFPVPVVGDHLCGPLDEFLRRGSIGFERDNVTPGLVKDNYILHSAGCRQFDYPFKTTQEVFVSIINSKDAPFWVGVPEGRTELFGGDPGSLFLIEYKLNREVVKLFLDDLGLNHGLAPYNIVQVLDIVFREDAERIDFLFKGSTCFCPCEDAGEEAFRDFPHLAEITLSKAGPLNNCFKLSVGLFFWACLVQVSFNLHKEIIIQIVQYVNKNYSK